MTRCKVAGFTLIEVLVFIIISSLLMSTILIGSRFVLQKTPESHQHLVATQLARQCLEGLLQQERQVGPFVCPSSPSHPLCTPPANYNIITSVSCASWNQDNSYQILSVSVSGIGSASLSIWLGQSS